MVFFRYEDSKFTTGKMFRTKKSVQITGNWKLLKNNFFLQPHYYCLFVIFFYNRKVKFFFFIYLFSIKNTAAAVSHSHLSAHFTIISQIFVHIHYDLNFKSTFRLLVQEFCLVLVCASFVK